MIDASQTIILDSLDLHSDECQLYLNTTGIKLKKKSLL